MPTRELRLDVAAPFSARQTAEQNGRGNQVRQQIVFIVLASLMPTPELPLVRAALFSGQQTPDQRGRANQPEQ
jgi:hypothetical protein